MIDALLQLQVIIFTCYDVTLNVACDDKKRRVEEQDVLAICKAVMPWMFKWYVFGDSRQECLFESSNTV